MLIALLIPIILCAILLPFAFIFIAWDHDMVRSFPALPAPKDLGTREFLWRCRLSKLAKKGWRKRILRAPCPRITLRCRFALLYSDFAKLTATLGFDELKLETIPFLYPQIAFSALFLQILGHSKFPTSVHGAAIKSFTICQIRPLDMQFPDRVAKDSKHLDGGADSDVADDGVGFQCFMILTNKRFLEREIEFDIQTDLFDEKGTIWQSVTTFSIPFQQKKLIVPFAKSVAKLDSEILSQQKFTKASFSEFYCSQSKYDDFVDVSMPEFGLPRHRARNTPLMWSLGNALASLQRQKHVPPLPLLATFVINHDPYLPLGTKLKATSYVATDSLSHIVRLDISSCSNDQEESPFLSSLLRTVGWNYVEDS